MATAEVESVSETVVSTEKVIATPEKEAAAAVVTDEAPEKAVPTTEETENAVPVAEPATEEAEAALEKAVAVAVPAEE